MALFAKWRASFWAAWCEPREPRRLKRDIKLSCTSPLTVPNMLFVVLVPLWAPQHLLQEAKWPPCQMRPRASRWRLWRKVPEKKVETAKCLPCTHRKHTDNFFNLIFGHVRPRKSAMREIRPHTCYGLKNCSRVKFSTSDSELLAPKKILSGKACMP